MILRPSAHESKTVATEVTCVTLLNCLNNTLRHAINKAYVDSFWSKYNKRTLCFMNEVTCATLVNYLNNTLTHAISEAYVDSFWSKYDKRTLCFMKDKSLCIVYTLHLLNSSIYRNKITPSAAIWRGFKYTCIDSALQCVMRNLPGTDA
jgi:hypothetical protein